MTTTLLALYRRPTGGVDAQTVFERRYAAEHLPLVTATPEHDDVAEVAAG